MWPEDRIACQRLVARALGHFTELCRMLSDEPDRMYDISAATSTRDTLPCLSRAIRLAKLGAVAFLVGCGGPAFETAPTGLAAEDSGAASAAAQAGSGGATVEPDAGAPGSGGTASGGAPGAGGKVSGAGGHPGNSLVDAGAGGVAPPPPAAGGTGTGTGGAPTTGGFTAAGGAPPLLDIGPVLDGRGDCTELAEPCYVGSQSGAVVTCTQSTPLQANRCLTRFPSPGWCCVGS